LKIDILLQHQLKIKRIGFIFLLVREKVIAIAFPQKVENKTSTFYFIKMKRGVNKISFHFARRFSNDISLKRSIIFVY
jgi:hypothetical protein